MCVCSSYPIPLQFEPMEQIVCTFSVPTVSSTGMAAVEASEVGAIPALINMRFWNFV
jgi:hypothetical protein